MKNQVTEQHIQKMSQQLLDQSVDGLDESISLRLKKARHLALQSNLKSSYVPQWSGAFAVIIILFVVVWIGGESPSTLPDDMILVEDMMQIEESQDFLNDIEFYQWLEQRGELV